MSIAPGGVPSGATRPSRGGRPNRPSRATFYRRRLVAATAAALLLALAVVAAGRAVPGAKLPVDDTSPRRATLARGKPVAHTPPTATASPAPPPALVTAVTDTLVAGGLTRSYQVWAPPVAAGTRLPALIVLAGTGASLDLEEGRDGLLPLVQQGKAILVYPHDYKLSWNAGACCGGAKAAGVNDLAFMEALVPALQARADVGQISLVGYSNGGRLVFDVACSDPSLVPSYAVVTSAPVVGCRTTIPVNLLDLAGTRDPDVQYDDTTPTHTTNGFREPSVVDEVRYWRARGACPAQPAATTAGTLQLQVWAGCTNGTAVALGTYVGGDHAWQPGTATTPSAASVIWNFLDGSHTPGQL